MTQYPRIIKFSSEFFILKKEVRLFNIFNPLNYDNFQNLSIEITNDVFCIKANGRTLYLKQSYSNSSLTYSLSNVSMYSSLIFSDWCRLSEYYGKLTCHRFKNKLFKSRAAEGRLVVIPIYNLVSLGFDTWSRCLGCIPIVICACFQEKTKILEHKDSTENSTVIYESPTLIYPIIHRFSFMIAKSDNVSCCWG